MLVIAQHHINDPENFWKAAKAVSQSLPSGMSIHAIYPSRDGNEGTCIWEADSVDAVQTFLDENAGKLAKNVCYEINAEEAIGLPQGKMQASQAN